MNDMALELARLHVLRGADFVRQLILLNICTTYNSRLMAIQIRNYFNVYPDALEVLIYKGKKTISVTRRFVESPLYLIQFIQKYEK